MLSISVHYPYYFPIKFYFVNLELFFQEQIKTQLQALPPFNLITITT